MQRYQQLMVSLARKEADSRLIAYAAMIARMGTAQSIRFVHVAPDKPAQDLRVIQAELESGIKKHFTGVSTHVPIAYDVLDGPLVDRLLAHTADKHVDLLLVGDGRNIVDRRSLVRRLAMKAPCSVWLVPEGAPATLQRILVPVDFSESAADSLRVATSMAKLHGHGECLALHVYFNEAAITYEGYDQVLRGEEAEEFNKFVAPIDTQGVKVTPLFEEGANVPNVVQRVAEREKVDLIIMGTRGRSRSSAILLGSVTEEMIASTRCALLAVKHFGARLSVLQALLDRRFWQQGEIHT